MRYVLIALWMLLGSVTSAMAQVSIGIGINLPVYPQLVRVPGYPVYYAPNLRANFFFYDGLYWVFQADHWYASSWYNGPWRMVAPEVVPVYVLRVPVRYYRHPPGYFRGWRPDAPPRWGEHWGGEWQQRRSGWDQWNRRAVPAPAPLPIYQRQYSGNRYPREDQQQRMLHDRNYRYQPRDPVVRQHSPERAAPRAPAPVQRERQGAPQERAPRPPEQDRQRSSPPAPPRQGGPTERHPESQPGPGRREQQSTPRQDDRSQGRGASQAPRHGQERERDRSEERGQERGHERNR